MSTTIAWEVGTNYRDAFTYNVTGLVDADFTKIVVKNGVNAATTGIVITEIGSTVCYDVSVSGITGFVATAGFYQLVIYRTAIPSDRWESQIVVGAAGLQVITNLASVSFTSTSGDGRVTDGSLPLLGAQVYIIRPNGDLYALLTTDVAGNWGPFFPAEDGTYSIIVQLSGYTVGSASLIVSAGGTVITGPGADIVLTAATISNGVLASSLWAYARRQFHSRNGAMADQQVRESVTDALNMLASAKDWPWLYTTGRINFFGTYQTGTITVTQGSAVVTLAGGTFPSWAADGEIYVAGQWQKVLTRDSNSQVTLVNAWASPDTDGSGLSYYLSQWEYDLPTDCRTVVNIINQQGWLWGPVPVSRWKIDLARQSQMYAAGSPSGTYIYAIERDRICVWPPPVEDLMTNVLYVKSPAQLTTGTDVADWDPLQLESLYRCIDYQISMRGECVAGPTRECYDRYIEALNRAYSNDRTGRPKTVGYSGSGLGNYIPATGNVVNL